jgi:predicted AlkP superfamily phosphohydrolase/phosphomutase
MAAPRVLLIGWDSADWSVASPLVDQGQLPHLERLISRGVMSNLTSQEPLVDPALWTSLATGRRPGDHRVLGYAEVSTDRASARPVTSASRAAPAIWNMLSSSGIPSHAVGWPATQGDRIEHGCIVSDWFPAPTARPGEPWPPAPPGTIWPSALESTLNVLRVSPAEVDADIVRLFVPLASEVNQDADFRLQRLRVYLAAAFSIQAAATWLLEHEPCEFMGVRFAALGAICREFMPYHPPQMAGMPDRHFRIYSDVVSSAYRLHDLMLGRLAALAGEGATIVLASQHGYRSDHRRPSSERATLANSGLWARPQGIFAAAGPALRKDELIHGASLLDVVPTLLALYQLPISAEMPGRVLGQAFVREPPPKAVSFETSAGSLPETSLNFDGAEAQAAARHCRSIDYIGPYADLPLERPAAIAMNNNWTLARGLMTIGAPLEALPLLQALYRDWPERIEFGQLLCECEQLLSLETARDTLEATLEYVERRDLQLMARAAFAYRAGSIAESLDFLTQAKSAGAAGLELHRQLALTLLALRRWSDAERVCRHVIESDPEQALAYVGLAECLLRQRKLQAASETAKMAAGLNYELAPAHFILGVARWRLGDIDGAVTALHAATRLAPQVPLYQRMLSILYARSGEPTRAAAHMALSQRLLAERRKKSMGNQAPRTR